MTFLAWSDADLVAAAEAAGSDPSAALPLARRLSPASYIRTAYRTAYRTMGVTSRSQAVLWGVDHGLRPRRARVLLPQTTRVGG